MFLGEHFNHKDPHNCWLKKILKDDFYTLKYELSNEKWISLIWIWNYNNSRTRSYWGVKSIAILNE